MTNDLSDIKPEREKRTSNTRYPLNASIGFKMLWKLLKKNKKRHTSKNLDYSQVEALREAVNHLRRLQRTKKYTKKKLED